MKDSAVIVFRRALDSNGERFHSSFVKAFTASVIEQFPTMRSEIMSELRDYFSGSGCSADDLTESLNLVESYVVRHLDA
jgi:hypothetical protein